MYQVDWKLEARNIGLVLLLAALIGLIFQQFFLCLFMGSVAYSGWFLYQLHRVQKWLSEDEQLHPPESYGLWGEVLNGIYHRQKRKCDQLERVQARLDYLRGCFQALNDGVIMLDEYAVIEWANPAVERLLGISAQADIGQSLTNLVRNPGFVKYFESEDYEEFLEFSPQQNSDLYLQLQITFFGKGSRLLFVRDITHTHRLQQMRKDFIANVSHELRTPLTVITGYLETLLGSPLGEDLRWRKAMEQMLAQSHRMESLVRDLILLSRLEAIPEVMDQQDIDLEPMLQVIRDEVATAIKGERHIELYCDNSLKLSGHPDELRSAFTNLVMNAAKYSEEGDSITVRWYTDNEAAYLEVKDTGIGIDEFHIPRLTERFYRVDPSRHTETGGTGLGLAIVKHVLSRHQAELRVESQLGEGSRFICVFPLQRAIPESVSA
jgi:two-component system phosphate regulon sensor histidine kinase PhoR